MCGCSKVIITIITYTYFVAMLLFSPFLQMDNLTTFTDTEPKLDLVVVCYDLTEILS